MMNSMGSLNTLHSGERRTGIDILAQATVNSMSNHNRFLDADGLGGVSGTGGTSVDAAATDAVADGGDKCDASMNAKLDPFTEDGTTTTGTLRGTGTQATTTSTTTRYITIVVTFSSIDWINSGTVPCLSLCSTALH
jgi:hypothetical protein